MSSIRDFIPLSKLGEGTYSTVYKVKRNTDQQIYALKKVKMTQLSTKEKENALNQIRILASIESPYIISYKQAFFDETINVLCIVMEYAEDGDLLRFIEENKKSRSRIDQREIWKACKSILSALNNLHSRGIMHRDLKSANIFKSKVGYKLGDLNVSKVVSGQLAYTQTGTPYYASPEVWRDEPYDAKSDIWSFGCIIYEMASLKPPFEGKTMQQLYKNIQNRPIPLIPTCYSQQLSQLVNLCLKKRPSERLNAAEILANQTFGKYFKNADLNQLSSKLKPSDKQLMKNQLLNTIKLPSDLKKLKEKLPISKYAGQNKSFVTIQQAKMVEEIHQNKKPDMNKSEVYRSPPSKVTLFDQNLPRSPVTDLKIDPQTYNVIAKYSERLQMSEKKSNKIERPIQKNYLNIEKYIKEQLNKRPHSSMPKTEKSQARREVYQSVTPMSSQPHLYAQGDIRQRLAKKSRVLSGMPRPSWWG